MKYVREAKKYGKEIIENNGISLPKKKNLARVVIVPAAFASYSAIVISSFYLGENQIFDIASKDISHHLNKKTVIPVLITINTAAGATLYLMSVLYKKIAIGNSESLSFRRQLTENVREGLKQATFVLSPAIITSMLSHLTINYSQDIYTKKGLIRAIWPAAVGTIAVGTFSAAAAVPFFRKHRRWIKTGYYVKTGLNFAFLFMSIGSTSLIYNMRIDTGDGSFEPSTIPALNETIAVTVSCFGGGFILGALTELLLNRLFGIELYKPVTKDTILGESIKTSTLENKKSDKDTAALQPIPDELTSLKVNETEDDRIENYNSIQNNNNRKKEASRAATQIKTFINDKLPKYYDTAIKVTNVLRGPISVVLIFFMMKYLGWLIGNDMADNNPNLKNPTEYQHEVNLYILYFYMYAALIAILPLFSFTPEIKCSRAIEQSIFEDDDLSYQDESDSDTDNRDLSVLDL